MKAARRDGAFGPLAFAVLSSLVACRGRASPEDCRAMTEHYVDLAVREAPSAARLSPAQKEAVREVERGLKRAEPSFRGVEDDCGHVTRAEVSCANDSTTTAAWEGCLRDAGR
jgi:hypothetical protein